ncbi:GntR family transcriptional regulator [Lentisphaerota bacterium ZTH]|nr:GntR family transcriptional regulator [Lentisphaerota bacterium]WET06534.1 GntR family transcriptional regulator [Lentisphaerota bacterium ZTH]
MASVAEKRQQIINIWEWILEKTIPDDSFTNEYELCEQFAISRTQLRDILKELEVRGIIERRQRKGIRIRELSDKEISDIFEVREALESIAARNAAVRATARDIRLLRKYSNTFDKAMSKGETKLEIESEIAFHQKIVDMSGNIAVQRIIKQLMLIEKVFKMGKGVRPGISHEPRRATHNAIISALETHDGDLAEELVKEHIIWSKGEALELSLEETGT